MTAETRTAIRTCPLCEATCGLELTIEDGRVTRVRGDADDVFSKGFICPKGASIGELHDDPDRLRAPLLRRPDGGFDEVSWEEAFAFIDERFRAVESAHGRAAFGMYLGNPAAHSISAVLYGRVLAKALGTRAIFTASTVDQMPKQLASALMFGTGLSVPIPDLDRTMHLLVLGADPLVSNGSLMTSPDARGRLRAIRARGGRLVVVDPRRSRTAAEADEHHFIRPGTDALLLMAIVHTLFMEKLAAPGEHLTPHIAGLDELRALAEPFAPEAVAAHTGIEAGEIRRIARELAAAAPAAAVYGRIGTTTQAFGALASWLVDVVNVLIGGLDHPGGAMFTRPASGSSNTAGEPGRGRGMSVHRWSSRVSGRGEVFGELPAVCMAEEISQPGDGQVRALFTIAGNPVLSLPNGDRVADALDTLELMVSVDIYLNETTRHADVILPPPSVLERSHYDIALYSFAVRNVANYSPPALPLPEDALDEWQILLRLTGIATGQGPEADIEAIDAFVAGELARRATVTARCPVEGRDPQELVAQTSYSGPERLLDIALRTGPYGDGFGADPDGLTLAALEEKVHGIDFGALSPRVPELLRTQSGKIELAPELLVTDVPRLLELLGSDPDRNGDLTLIGRRQLRSNNSWMHNLPKLVSGPERCTVLVSPADAERLGIGDGEPAQVSGPGGSIELTAQVTADMMPGVVSIPHGWGHDLDGADLSVAREHAGANVNLLGDSGTLEPLSGTAVLNGVPVTLAPARRPAAV